MLEWRALESGPMHPLLVAVILAALVPRADIVQHAAAQGEVTWRRCQAPDSLELSSRELFTTALAWCEAGQHADRLALLFDLAAQLQDRRLRSRTQGNFRWYWTHADVDDPNAVEYCLQAGALLWMRHRDTMPADAREKLEGILRIAADASRLHRVPADYTNMAFMNASNLILLGECLQRPKVAREGYRRLDAAVRSTRKNGTHEYCSPAYYGMNVVSLGLLEAFAQREGDRDLARAMLELLWTDIGANWLPSLGRLSGAQSRTYDYLHGLGPLDTALWANRWIDGEPRGGSDAIHQALIAWHPPDSLRAMTLPRQVCQGWGERPEQFRTHYLLDGISLSTAGSSYEGRMDMPLTVDFAGDRESVRGYFVPDGRDDPYGGSKIPSGAHPKAKHLSCYFAGAQRRTDAAAIVVYRDGEIPAGCTALQTHFVLPRDADAFYVGAQRVEGFGEVPLAPGQALVVRKGTTAVGIRVPWTRDDAPVALVDDSNDLGAVRLTVRHAVRPGAAAALWVRIGSGLDTDEAFEAWRRAFAEATADVVADAKTLQLRVAGEDGPVGIVAAAPFTSGATCEPAPRRVVLEVDGMDVGRRILGSLDLE
jgi:hypothetical protein